APSSRGRWPSTRRETHGGTPRQRTVGSWWLPGPEIASLRKVYAVQGGERCCESSPTEVARTEFLTRTGVADVAITRKHQRGVARASASERSSVTSRGRG